MRLTGTSTAKAYHFRSEDHRCAWAICTVNDTTGELSVQSDAGNWAHRWNTAHLGGGATLTRFLGDRDAVHYLFGKLTSRQDERIDTAGTLRNCAQSIIDRRRDGQLDKDEAREVYDELMESEGTLADSVDDWLSSLSPELRDAVGEPLYESIRMEPTTSAVVLRDLILPALIAACRADVERAAATAQTEVSQ